MVKNCKVVSFGTMKGGTGKSSLAVQISACLANRGKRVLFLDLDPQANATEALGLPMTKVDRYYSTAGLFTGKKVTLGDFIIEGMIPELPNLYLIPAHLQLVRQDRDLVQAVMERNMDLPEAELLERVFKDNEDFINENFDYIILDTNTYLSQINENAFSVVDSFIYITDPSYEGLMGIASLAYLWNEIADQIGKEVAYKDAIVLNKYEKGYKLSEKIYSILKGEFSSEEDESLYGGFSEAFIDYPIPKTVKFGESSFSGVPMIATKQPDQKMILGKVESLIDKSLLRGIYNMVINSICFISNISEL